MAEPLELIGQWVAVDPLSGFDEQAPSPAFLIKVCTCQALPVLACRPPLNWMWASAPPSESDRLAHQVAVGEGRYRFWAHLAFDPAAQDPLILKVLRLEALSDEPKPILSREEDAAVSREGQTTQSADLGQPSDALTLDWPTREPRQDLRQRTYRTLFSGQLPHIGPVRAKRLWETYGEAALTVLEEDPERVAQEIKIPLKYLPDIQEAILALEFDPGLESPLLDVLDLSETQRHLLAQAPWARGEAALEANPYRLLAPPLELSFERVDQAVLALGWLTPTDPCRIKAGLMAILRQAQRQGWVCLNHNQLVAETTRLLKLPSEAPCQALADCLPGYQAQPDAPVDRYLSSLYEAETYVLETVLQRLRASDSDGLSDWAGALEYAREQAEIQLTEQQQAALEILLRHKTVLLTGGPGTGKTTLMQLVCTCFEYRKESVALCAPTGRAAKRLENQVGRPACTLHRLLEAAPDPLLNGQLRMNRDETNPLDERVVILDEASMVDLKLFASLLKALKPQTRLILVGDANQLPPVGAGPVFQALLAVSQIPRANLTQIMRQKAQSLIIQNAHAILVGQRPKRRQTIESDWLEISEAASQTTVNPGEEPASIRRIYRLLTEQLQQTYGIDPWQEAQILTPLRSGPEGVRAINDFIQAKRQAAQPTEGLNLKGKRFHVGDRVMQTKNDYQMLATDQDEPVTVFNGERGVVTAVSPDHQSLIVLFEDDKTLSYPTKQIPNLDLAYAMTVHKAQGCEFEAAIVLLPRQPSLLENRSVLYTAVTRAKKQLFLFHAPGVLNRYLNQERQEERSFHLTQRLQDLIKKRGCQNVDQDASSPSHATGPSA